MKISLLLLFCIVFISCNHFEFSPNQTFDRNSPKDLNAANLERLGNGSGDDTIKFVLTGDTQKSRDETVEFCKKVNTIPDVDFVVLDGDISEFGILKEMEWISETFEDLNAPHVAVIGNHDLTSRGMGAFLNMFGALNYSFVYGGIKFICHDTNGREYNFNGNIPDLAWLGNELKPSEGVTGFVGISHVPVNSPDFDPGLIKDYTSSFAQTPGFLASLNAHNHNYEVFHPDDSGIPYIIISAVQNNEFLVVRIVNNKLSFERVFF